jgi:hypothetical protein
MQPVNRNNYNLALVIASADRWVEPFADEIEKRKQEGETTAVYRRIDGGRDVYHATSGIRRAVVVPLDDTQRAALPSKETDDQPETEGDAMDDGTSLQDQIDLDLIHKEMRRRDRIWLCICIMFSLVTAFCGVLGTIAYRTQHLLEVVGGE